jgi:NAD(P)-dependent dehydrogenase (short-subunit alcohol dehydrogenase family)
VTDIIKGSLDADEGMRNFMLAKHPVGRFGTVDEIASAVIYLCTPGAAFITGVALPVDGGWTA